MPDKKTRWEKNMWRAGYDIIPFTHDEIVDHLLQVFVRDREHLLADAAADDTKRHSLTFILDYDNLGDKKTIFGGTVTYSKKQRRFTHITYSDNRNWAVQFSIERNKKEVCYTSKTLKLNSMKRVINAKAKSNGGYINEISVKLTIKLESTLTRDESALKVERLKDKVHDYLRSEAGFHQSEIKIT